MREVLDANPIGIVTVATVTVLCLLVGGVGVVALWAEFVGTWQSLFIMEQVIATVTPAVVALAAGLILTAAGLIAWAN